MPARTPIRDLTACVDSFLQLDAEALGQIRKTSEDPPRVSIFDVIQAVTGQSNPRMIYSRLKEAFPEVVTDLPVPRRRPATDSGH